MPVPRARRRVRGAARILAAVGAVLLLGGVALAVVAAGPELAGTRFADVTRTPAQIAALPVANGLLIAGPVALALALLGPAVDGEARLRRALGAIGVALALLAAWGGVLAASLAIGAESDALMSGDRQAGSALAVLQARAVLVGAIGDAPAVAAGLVVLATVVVLVLAPRRRAPVTGARR